jgi:hypothetical protein
MGIWIDGSGYVVFPRDGVNGLRRNLLACIGVVDGCRREQAQR